MTTYAPKPAGTRRRSRAQGPRGDLMTIRTPRRRRKHDRWNPASRPSLLILDRPAGSHVGDRPAGLSGRSHRRPGSGAARLGSGIRHLSADKRVLPGSAIAGIVAAVIVGILLPLHSTMQTGPGWSGGVPNAVRPPASRSPATVPAVTATPYTAFSASPTAGPGSLGPHIADRDQAGAGSRGDFFCQEARIRHLPGRNQDRQRQRASGLRLADRDVAAWGQGSRGAERDRHRRQRHPAARAAVRGPAHIRPGRRTPCHLHCRGVGAGPRGLHLQSDSLSLAERFQDPPIGGDHFSGRADGPPCLPGGQC